MASQVPDLYLAFIRLPEEQARQGRTPEH